MEKTVAMLSSQEFEHLLTQIIDNRMEVWFTQLLDTLSFTKEEDEAPLQAEFINSLNRAIEQVQTGNTIGLDSFRKQLAHEAL